MQSKTAHNAEIAALHSLLEEQERTIAHMDEAIRDLRTRLDLEAAERREVSAQLRGLLTARMAKGVDTVDTLGGPLPPAEAQPVLRIPGKSPTAGTRPP